jgi:hypothetical protein
MVPSLFVTLESLPRTPNGKIDRDALPLPDPASSVTAAAYRPPESEVERTLVAIWQEVLGLARVGTDDNFFDLSGNSLLAVKLVNRIRQELAPTLSLVTLFERPTVRGLARAIAADSTADLKQRQRGKLRRERLARRRRRKRLGGPSDDPEE